MVFKRKGSFFLDLSGGDKAAPAPPVQVAIADKGDAAKKAPAADQPAEAKAPAGKAPQAEPMAASATASAPDSAAASTLTTAEAIAAELRAAQEALPPPSQVTFAPECLNPANALPARRRRPGANLGAFKGMASQMFRN